MDKERKYCSCAECKHHYTADMKYHCKLDLSRVYAPSLALDKTTSCEDFEQLITILDIMKRQRRKYEGDKAR